MIKDLLSNSFAVKCKFHYLSFVWSISHLFFHFTAETSINDAQSATMKSLISRAGDLSKNNDRLKFALVSVRFPEAYNETM